MGISAHRAVSHDLPRRQVKAAPAKSICVRGPAVNTPKCLIAIILQWSEGNELPTQGIDNELGSSLRPRLAHGFRDVHLHSSSGESQLVRNRLIAQTGNQQADNVELAFRERLVSAGHGAEATQNCRPFKESESDEPARLRAGSEGCRGRHGPQVDGALRVSQTRGCVSRWRDERPRTSIAMNSPVVAAPHRARACSSRRST